MQHPLSSRSVPVDPLHHVVADLRLVLWRADAATLACRYVSPEAEAVFGYPAARWIAEPFFWLGLIDPQDGERIRRECAAATAKLRPHELKYRMRAADGRTVWVRDVVRVVAVDGVARELAGAMFDISGTRAAHEPVVQSRTLLRALLDNSPSIIFVKDLDGRYLEVNRAFEKLLARPRGAVMGRSDAEVFPEEVAGQFRAHDLEVIAEGRALEFEEIVDFADGPRVSLAQKFPLADEAGSIYATGGIVADFTERKRAEEQLSRYATRLKALRHLDAAILAASSPADIARAALGHLSELIPYQRASVVTLDVATPQATVLAAAGRGIHLLGPGSTMPLETFGDLADLREGRMRYIEDLGLAPGLTTYFKTVTDLGLRAVIVAPLINSGTLVGTLNVWASRPAALTLEHADIAREVASQLAVAIAHASLHARVERHAAELEQREQALRLSESRYRFLFEGSPLPMWAYDLESRCFRLANAAAVSLYGYTRDEFLAMTADQMRPAEELARWVEHMHELQEDQYYSGPWRHRKKDGSVIDVDVFHHVVRLDGRPTVVSLIHDVTTRKRLQDQRDRYSTQLQEVARRLVTLQESERRSLAAELHDRIGQSLSALGIKLTMVGSLLEPPQGEAIAVIRESQAILEDTGRAIRGVISELRPAALHDYGLAAALNTLAEQSRRRYGMEARLDAPDLESRLPAEVEAAFFRIAQEALANVAKHARAPEVSLTLRSRGRRTRLCIVDRGRGFDMRSLRSPGKLSRWGLLMMRERAESVGARLRIRSTPGAGTYVLVSWRERREHPRPAG